MARDDEWIEYFDATMDRAPRENLLQALQHTPHDGTALELGCGVGHDVIAMLRHGLTVTAIDFHPEAVQRTLAAARRAGLADRLNALCCAFESFPFDGTYDLIHSSFSIPFCPPQHFETTWWKMRRSMAADGLLALILFGDRDEWACTDKAGDTTYLSRGDVDRLITGLERLRDEEVEHDGPTALGAHKHWHLFRLLLRAGE
ncbi:MAG: class I SAM-dependent methyltransferase [Phycisphaerales bacterium]|nr:class I SAM-dependent methyltransferase [Phycisphaerales bacterium]